MLALLYGAMICAVNTGALLAFIIWSMVVAESWEFTVFFMILFSLNFMFLMDRFAQVRFYLLNRY